MSHDYSDFKEQEPVDSILSKISEMAVEQKKAEAVVAQIEEDLQKAKDKLKDIAEFKLPELMDSIEMTKFTLKDGSEVVVGEKIRASIPAKFTRQAFSWLEQHHHENLIKEQITLDFNRDQTELSEEFMAMLEAKWGSVRHKHKKSVHASTLSSFVKEQLGEGVAIPLDLFGVYRQRFTKVSS